MRRLFSSILILAVILVGLALFLPSIVPASAYRDRVQTAASTALNRPVMLDGEIGFSILPKLQVSAANVRIANPDGFGDGHFASMGEMRVSIALAPLFSRQVEIEEFVLIDPEINLVERRSGNNWTFAAGDGASAGGGGGSGEGFVRRPGALPIETSFGDVRVENATIRYSGGGQRHEITGLDLTVALPSVDDPVNLNGQLRANGEALRFAAELGSLRGLFEGAETGLDLTLSGALVDASFNGRIPAGEIFALNGRVDTTVPQPRRLAAFAGAELPPGDNLNRFEIDGDLDYRPGHVGFENARVVLDDLDGSGGLNVDLSGAKPRVTGRLHMPQIDVTPYLPASEDGRSGGGVPPWSEDEIDLAGLHVLDADVTVTTDRLSYRDLQVDDALIRVRITRGRLAANLNRFNLYGGQGSGRIVANGRGQRPSFSLFAELNGLDALPFLDAAAGFDRLQGLGTMRIDLLGAGANANALMNSLDGSGSFSFLDGAIVGINIAEAIRTVQASLASRSLPSGFGDGEQTDFSSLTGSFNIANGRVVNDDLLMLSPLLRIPGAGSVDLGGQSIDYRLQPRAVASIQGQGGDRDLRGLVVPIRIRGSFNDISAGVDMDAVGQALLSGAISNAIGGNNGDGAQSPEDLVRDGLLNALGLGGNDEQDGDASEDEASSETEEEIDPAELLLRSLLGQTDEEDGDGN